MNIVLWILQGLLALGYLGAGGMKAFSPREKILANPQLQWATDFSAQQIKLIGLAELLGGVGLVVPWATGILPILTPVAAIALTVIMGGAVQTHLRRKEPVGPSAVFLVLTLAVGIGRFLVTG